VVGVLTCAKGLWTVSKDPEHSGTSLLLLFAVLLFVLGAFLSILYGFDLLKDITQPFLENPTILLELAGILSLGALAIIAWGIASQHFD
jgi:hypothetical protein